ncbi:MAG: PASTA domain-containing protein [Thermodesulfobacteriota bacterium]|nr:PASTA domain-containing protein [Thermodesulfobacteriota bacterium]
MISRILKLGSLFFLFVLIVGASAYFTLTLIIKSEDTVVVPDLSGKNVVYVLELLTDLGLNTKVKGSEYSAYVPENNVIFQEPEPGAEIKKGRDVRIIISKGAKSILMPNLKGLFVRQARIILEENSLRRGEISSTYSNTIKKDEIIAQIPSPGSMITRGECVNLLVSMGIRPRAYKMPDLIGLSLNSAITMIESMDLVLVEIKTHFYTGKPLNTVVAQELPSGYRVTQGSAVNIVINRKPVQKGHNYLNESQGGGLFRYRLKDGFLKRHIKVRLNSFGVSADLVDGFMKPGEEIWLLIPRKNNATLFLYEDGELIKTLVYDEG